MLWYFITKKGEYITQNDMAQKAASSGVYHTLKGQPLIKQIAGIGMSRVFESGLTPLQCPYTLF